MHCFVLVWQELMWMLKYFKGWMLLNDKIQSWSTLLVAFVVNDKVTQYFSLFRSICSFPHQILKFLKGEKKSSNKASRWHFLTTVVFYSAIKSIFHKETHFHVLLQWRLFVDWRSFLVKRWWIPCVKTEAHQTCISWKTHWSVNNLKKKTWRLATSLLRMIHQIQQADS